MPSSSRASFSPHPRRTLSQGSILLPPCLASSGCLLAFLLNLLIARWVAVSLLTKDRIVIERRCGCPGPESWEEKRGHRVCPRCSPVMSQGWPTDVPACEAKAPVKPVTNYQQGESCSAEAPQSLRLQNLSRFRSQAVKQPKPSQLLKGIVITLSAA